MNGSDVTDRELEIVNEQEDSFQEVPRDRDEAPASPAANDEGCPMVLRALLKPVKNQEFDL